MYNQHEETDQNSAGCCSLSFICLSVRLSVGSPSAPPKMFAAFRSSCLHLSDSCRQANRSAAKGSVSNSHKTTPRSSQSSSLERNQGSALGALRPLRFCLARLPKDSCVRKLMRCKKKKKKAAWFAKNAHRLLLIKTGGAGKGLVRMLLW